MAEMNPIEKAFVNRVNQRYIPRKFREIFQEIEPVEDAEWLELGAGKGYISVEADQALDLEEIHVTDYDPAQIKLAKQYIADKYNNEIPKRYTIEQANALDLDYPNDSMDIITASLMLHHLEPGLIPRYNNIPDALEEIKRILRPDGVFLCLETKYNHRIKKTLDNLEMHRLFNNRHLIVLQSYGYKKPR